MDHGPAIAADQFHPWVWEAAKPLWPTGEYASALGAVAVSVNAQLRKKVGRSDLAEAKLVQEAFSKDDPKEGRPRLRLGDPADPDTATSRREGAMSLGAALFKGVRNVVQHTDKQYDEQEALEALAAWSLFARWVDEATVEAV